LNRRCGRIEPHLPADLFCPRRVPSRRQAAFLRHALRFGGFTGKVRQIEFGFYRQGRFDQAEPEEIVFFCKRCCEESSEQRSSSQKLPPVDAGKVSSIKHYVQDGVVNHLYAPSPSETVRAKVRTHLYDGYRFNRRRRSSSGNRSGNGRRDRRSALRRHRLRR